MSEILLPHPPTFEANESINNGPLKSEIPSDFPGVRTEILDKNVPVHFSLDKMTEAIGVDNENEGIDQSLVGVIGVEEGTYLGVIRVTTADGEKVVALSKLTRDHESEGRASLVGLLKSGESITVGRNDIDPGNDFISNEHASITLTESGELVVEDKSTNGTTFSKFESPNETADNTGPRGLKKFLNSRKNVSKDKESSLELSDYISHFEGWSIKSSLLSSMLRSPESEWDYTKGRSDLAKYRENLKGYEEPYIDENGQEIPAKYLGREVIKRNSRINRGVYIVPGIQEAIVVDDKRAEEQDKPFSVYNQAYRRFLDKSKAKGVSVEHTVKQGQERSVVEAAWEATRDQIKYDIEFADGISEDFADKKVNLDVFIEAGKGVCRHQALLVAYHLERTIDAGFIKGTVSVDRNYIKDRGGHAWARYTDENGEVYIIDPAQNFVGTLGEADKLAEWDYKRPEERK